MEEVFMTNEERGSIVVPHLDRERILDIYAIRMELEGNTGQRAATLAQPSDIS